MLLTLSVKLTKGNDVMKKLTQKPVVQTEEVLEETGQAYYESLMGTRPILYCANFFYTGKIIGVNGLGVLLGNDASIVYLTGAHDSKKFSSHAGFGGANVFVHYAAIEACIEEGWKTTEED